MITITWVYQRPNKDMPFYQQSTTEAVANQSQFEDLKNNCGLVAGFEKFESDDGLSYTTIWKYNSIDEYLIIYLQETIMSYVITISSVLRPASLCFLSMII